MNEVENFINKLSTSLNVDYSLAVDIDKCLNEDEFTLRKNPIIKKYLSECYCYPTRHELALEIVARLSDLQVEGFRLTTGDEILYLNKGDMYNDTLIWDGRQSDFVIGKVGDIVESDEVEDDSLEYDLYDDEYECN